MKCLPAAFLVLLAACRSTPVERAAPGQPTMNELMHRRAAKAQAEMGQGKAAEAEVRSMTPEQARSMAQKLKGQPDDLALWRKLILYYQIHADVGPRSQLALWYIANHPNGTVAPETIHPAWSRVDWEKGAALWRKNLTLPGATAETWRRAARYLQGSDKAEAERTLLAAKEKYPKENWAAPLGQLYAMAILGAVGPLTELNAIRERSEEEAGSPFAKGVRAKLEASGDVGLLWATAQSLMAWSGRDRVRLVPFLDLLADRAALIDPNNTRGRAMKLRVMLFGDSLKPVDEGTRLRFLTIKLEQPFLAHRGEDREARARELLQLASAHKSEPAYGDAIYAANLALAQAALRKGDRRASARLLLASVEGPVTDRLRFGYLDMTLARELVDWGEREAVARFLERCSRFNVTRGNDLALWAADIRKGINPDLMPYHH